MHSNPNSSVPVKAKKTEKKKWESPSLTIINKDNPLREILEDIFREEAEKGLREK
jgi:hypothetical protein